MKWNLEPRDLGDRYRKYGKICGNVETCLNYGVLVYIGTQAVRRARGSTERFDCDGNADLGNIEEDQERHGPIGDIIHQVVDSENAAVKKDHGKLDEKNRWIVDYFSCCQSLMELLSISKCLS